MTGHAPESGLVPVAVLGYAKIAGWVANIALTGASVAMFWPSGDAGAELEAQADPAALADCHAILEAGTPLSPSSRAYYLVTLDNWQTYGGKRLAGQAVALATFNKTAQNLRELFQSEDDGQGRPVGLCHVSAGIQILNTQLEALAGGTAAELAQELGPPPAIYSQPSPTRWGVIAAAGALAGFALWRITA